jgi:NADH-quinone oxidoreductase E subunit
MISEDVKARMREIVARYPVARSAMLPCLHLAQEAEGYITSDGIAAVAEAVGARHDEVESIVTFYSMYRQAPEGKNVIKVCTSISCYLRGCDELLAHLEERLSIRRGQTTPDGAFTLKAVECLAACGMAPVLQVNDQFVENVTLDGADELIERLRGGGTVELHAGEWNVLQPAPGDISANGTSASAKREERGRAH